MIHRFVGSCEIPNCAPWFVLSSSTIPDARILSRVLYFFSGILILVGNDYRVSGHNGQVFDGNLVKLGEPCE